MSYTQAQLISHTLEELQALGAGQDVSSTDAAFVSSRVPGVVASLKARRIVTISNIEAIPDDVFPHLVIVLADVCAQANGAPRDEERAARAEARLVQLTRLDRTQTDPLVIAVLEQLQIWGMETAAVDATVVSARIPRLLADLSERGVIYIPDAESITPATMQPLIVLLASELSPRQNRDEEDRAERRLRHLASRQASDAPLRVSYF